MPSRSPDFISRLRARDAETQEVLWRRELPRLSRIAGSILRSPSRCEALVADLLVDFLYHHVDRVRSEEAIPAYLRIMALRRARREMSRQRRQETFEPQQATHDPSEAMAKALDDPIWSDRLKRCLAELSPKARKLLKLRYGHDLSYQAVAEAAGVSKQAAGKMGKKSLEALKRCLAKDETEATYG